jgi:uncharacterized membrane protein
MNRNTTLALGIILVVLVTGTLATTATSPTSPSSNTETSTTTLQVTPITATTPSSGSSNAAVFPFIYLVTAVVCVTVIVVGVIYLRRKGRRAVSAVSLEPEAEAILQFISEKGGIVLEFDLRRRFVLPKSSLWRLAKKLERMGYVRISRVGIQNVVELVKRV